MNIVKVRISLGFVTLLLLLVSCSHSPRSNPESAIGAGATPISYKTYGSGPATLIFVHGWVCDQSYWRDQISAFETDYQVVTLDLGGHGESPNTRSDYSIASFGQDVSAVADAVKAQEIVLIGHSMGGPVVLDAARRLGDRAIAVVGVDTLKRTGLPVLTREAAKKYHTDPYHDGFATRTEAMVRKSMFAASASPLLVEQISRDMAAADSKVALEASLGMFSYDIKTALSALGGQPLILINGDGSPTDAAALQQGYTNSKVVVLPDTGHFVMLERPELFNKTLREQLRLLNR